MLRSDWVESIHARLLVRYGDAWLRKWDGIDPAAVVADWAEELSGMSAGAIAHALANLPASRPPNSAEFKALAVNRPVQAAPALPAPPADPKRVASILSGLRARQLRDPLAWARDLKTRDEKHGGRVWGERVMTPTGRAMYRAALGLDNPTTEGELA